MLKRYAVNLGHTFKQVTMGVALGMSLSAYTAPTPEIPQGTPPPPNSLPITSAYEADCLKHPEWAAYHPTLDHKPVVSERQAMSANAGYIGSCIGVWRRHCLSSITSEVSGLSELCKFHADSTRAQVRNLLSLALGKITYLQYNAGIEAILKIQDDTDTKLLKLAQEHVDALVQAENTRKDDEEKKATARREEEVIAQLRQLNTQRSTPPPRTPITTYCNISGDGANAQCQSY